MPPEASYNNQFTPQPIDSLPKEPKIPNGSLKYIIVIVILLLILVGVAIFAGWSFVQMKDYKNNSDQKSAKAVEIAKNEQEKVLKAQFEEMEKEPLKSFIGPDQYGSVKIVYPKTWDAYIIQQSGDSTPLDGYFYPNYVPGISANTSTNYALRVQISSSSYKTEVDKYKSKIAKGQIKSSPFKPKQVKGSSVGVRLDGQIATGKQGSIIIVPVRDKILKIWTENEVFVKDLNNFVLENLTYSP
ncbi:hypothetical protein KBB76_00750 [Candidatus Saccharibacteria bacterium]|jgi:hypothetical protein|nr:hypothetical protein [Candidatus Saccharibacteria bacterium]HOR23111.1 hypothetical protein [Candidatus Saccharibacteria bacterium]HPW48216.1 hypothetical protein [Candidatus Saccharibacteria bacterium]